MFSAANVVKLKNGSEVPSFFVAITMIHLRNLLEKYPAVFESLLKGCHEETYVISDEHREVLNHFCLSEKNPLLKCVIVSAVRFNEGRISIISPVAGSV